MKIIVRRWLVSGDTKIWRAEIIPKVEDEADQEALCSSSGILPYSIAASSRKEAMTVIAQAIRRLRDEVTAALAEGKEIGAWIGEEEIPV